MTESVSKRVNSAALWTVPYAIAGFAAPLFFRYMPSPQAAGRIAGMVFVSAALWAVIVSVKHEHPLWPRAYFGITLALNAVFWAWRFSHETPMSQAYLLGLNGGAWHGLLTSLYLAGMLLLFFQEFRRTRVEDT